MVEVRIHPDARIELLETADWYFARSAEAARKFRESFEALLNVIRIQPESFPRYDSAFRFGKLDQFPCLIVFRLRNDGVDVIAVAHSRRRYGYWRERSFPSL